MPEPGRQSAAAPSFATPGVKPLVGIVTLIFSTWALSGLDAAGKWVMAAGVTLWVLCWVRYTVHLVLVLGLVLPLRGPRVLRSVRPRAQLLRGAVMLLATLCFFKTLSYLPQAEATAINFLAPLIVLSLAPWLLKEPPRISRWVAAAVGFLGVLIIIRPDAGLHPAGIAWGLLTACTFAVQFMATRRVAVDDPLTTLVWSGAVGTVVLSASMPVLLPQALPVLRELHALHWVVLVATGFLGALGHLLQIQAYRYAPASLLAPFVYIQIVAAAALGWLVWGQFPDALSWLGIAVVCGSGASLAAWEWRRRPARA
ncbi:MAG: DMT family transporter [Alcaligenaceae bacterium]|nr:DMT family transporter [Alcaligenaceae bacterium]